ncbi:MAG: hypothetical protein WCF26_03970 [Candidatus Sulfotelmatobacter sp.]
MGITQRKQHGFRLPAVLRSKQWMLCALMIDLLPVPLLGQMLHYPLQDKTAARLPATPDERVVIDKGDA